VGGWKIGRIGGVAVYVHPSWAIIALFLGFSEWTGFSDRFVFPSLSPAGALALAAITTLLFFGSVLAHELAHAEMSRARGIPVLGITLLLFGGVTHSTESPRTPKEEFLVTVVGPVTNLAIGGALLALHVWGGGFLSKPIRVGMVGFLAVENLLLGGFNLLPGFPLDGGRVLRALVWRATGDQRKATIVAGRGGQAVALLMVAAGITWTATTGNGLTLIWSVFIGMFIFQSASAVIAESRRQVLHVRHKMLDRPEIAQSGATRLDELFDTAYQVIARRSLVFVVSDFISRPGWAKPLAQLAQRHEVIAVRLYDNLEMDLPDLGLVVIQDAETGEQMHVDTNDRAFRRRFAAAAAKRETELRTAFRRAGVDALELATDDDLMDAILRFADLRKRRSRLAAGGTLPQHLEHR